MTQATIIIDPVTGWIEICSMPEARVNLVTNQIRAILIN